MRTRTIDRIRKQDRARQARFREARAAELESLRRKVAEAEVVVAALRERYLATHSIEEYQRLMSEIGAGELRESGVPTKGG